MAKGLNLSRTAQLANIRIKYEGEVFKFNLFEEVKITERLLEMEIKEQPSYYGFLTLLQKKLLTRFEDLKLERKKVEGTLFLQFKQEKGANGRPMTDDMAKASVLSHKDFILASRACIKAKDDADTIWACVKAFEQRKDLLQTLSSNTRRRD